MGVVFEKSTVNAARNAKLHDERLHDIQTRRRNLDLYAQRLLDHLSGRSRQPEQLLVEMVQKIVQEGQSTLNCLATLENRHWELFHSSSSAQVLMEALTEEDEEPGRVLQAFVDFKVKQTLRQTRLS